VAQLKPHHLGAALATLRQVSTGDAVARLKLVLWFEPGQKDRGFHGDSAVQLKPQPGGTVDPHQCGQRINDTGAATPVGSEDVIEVAAFLAGENHRVHRRPIE
jgi:hypothetical protein